jgi:hypothetical protein
VVSRSTRQKPHFAAVSGSPESSVGSIRPISYQ